MSDEDTISEDFTYDSIHEKHSKLLKKSSGLLRNENSNLGLFICVPKDIVILLFSYFNSTELMKIIALVCWDWYNLMQNSLIWKNIISECWKLPIDNINFDCCFCKYKELSASPEWNILTIDRQWIKLSEDKRKLSCTGSGWHTIQLGRKSFKGRRTFRFLISGSEGCIIGVAFSEWKPIKQYYPGGGSFGCSSRFWQSSKWSSQRNVTVHTNDSFESVALYPHSNVDSRKNKLICTMRIDTNEKTVTFFVNDEKKSVAQLPGRKGEPVIVLGSLCGGGVELSLIPSL